MTARPIPEKIRRIVPTLESSVDGEALGAARAIGRVLHANGQSYHDFAAAIPVHEPSPSPRAAPRPACWGGWRGAWVRDRRPRRYTPLQEARQEDQAVYCRSHATRLSERERSFVNGISPKRIGLSLKQGDWLADLTARLEMEGREWWQ